MRTLIVADIHGNSTALEAVFATREAQTCQRVISLGDQVNFGPQPREVIRRLRDVDALMLLGNHEHRLLHMDSPEFAAYNWALLRWTHAQLQGEDVNFPIDRREGCVLYTHGTPGDPFHLVQEEELSPVLDALPDGVTHLFSGHNHKPWLVRHGSKIACNPGSLGMLEDGHGLCAPFVVMEEVGGRIEITRHCAHYDAIALKRAFLQSGCVDAAPEMARIVLHTMLTGEHQAVLKLMRFIGDTAQALGLPAGSQEAWRAADEALLWQESIPTEAYWKNLKEELA